jgi:hypothetical protein
MSSKEEKNGMKDGKGKRSSRTGIKCVDMYAFMNWKLIKIKWDDIKEEITNEYILEWKITGTNKCK